MQQGSDRDDDMNEKNEEAILKKTHLYWIVY